MDSPGGTPHHCGASRLVQPVVLLQLKLLSPHAQARTTRVTGFRRSRICPPARPLRLFAAAGRDEGAKLAELAKADRQPALALTDTDNLFGALEFSDKLAGYGIQPIVGCELESISAIRTQTAAPPF